MSQFKSSLWEPLVLAWTLLILGTTPLLANQPESIDGNWTSKGKPDCRLIIQKNMFLLYLDGFVIPGELKQSPIYKNGWLLGNEKSPVVTCIFLPTHNKLRVLGKLNSGMLETELHKVTSPLKESDLDKMQGLWRVANSLTYKGKKISPIVFCFDDNLLVGVENEFVFVTAKGMGADKLPIDKPNADFPVDLKISIHPKSQPKFDLQVQSGPFDKTKKWQGVYNFKNPDELEVTVQSVNTPIKLNRVTEDIIKAENRMLRERDEKLLGKIQMARKIEANAQNALDAIKRTYLNVNGNYRPEKAIDQLQSLIKKYKGTKAAEEMQELLDSLKAKK